MSRREAWLSAAVALWGLAIAIALLPVWQQPPRPGQLVSAATVLGVDAHAPMRFILGLIVLPIAMPLLLRPLVRRLAAGQRWARNVAATSGIIALWFALITPSLPWVIFPCAAAIATAVILRNRDLAFTRHDAILLPSCAVLLFGVMDIAYDLPVDKALVIALLLLLAIRIALTSIAGPLPPAFAFALAPLGVALQTSFFPPTLRYLGWPAALLVTISPFVLRPLLRDRRRALALLAFVIYPIFAYSYTDATGLATNEGKPRVNLFEDAHHLLPASEMLRGEKLYRDIIPVHGLIEDGLSSYLPLRIRGVTIGDALRGRLVAGGLNAVAVYALGACITGAAEGGVFALFLAALFGTAGPSVRLLPATATLAVIAAAVRTRNPRLFALAGAGTALAVMTSLDFGAYTAITLAVAVIRQRSFRHAIMGGLAVTIALFIVLAAFGIAGDFVRVTLVDLPAAATTGTQNIFTPPEGFKIYRNVPEALAATFEGSSAPYMIWIAVAIFVATVITRRPHRRLEPMALLGVWMVVAAISYGQRHHLFFHLESAPLLAGGAWMLWRRRSAYAPVLTLAFLVLAPPTTHIAINSWLRHARGPLDPGWVEITHIPRARGVLFEARDATVIAIANKYVERSLLPEETFFDFTDRGLLFFLLRRDCPIRQPVVPFYQTDALQREVIARIESNPRVRAALVPKYPTDGVDRISNRFRAPLVWQYLETHFKPDYEEGDVVFWRRKSN